MSDEQKVEGQEPVAGEGEQAGQENFASDAPVEGSALPNDEGADDDEDLDLSDDDDDDDDDDSSGDESSQ